MGVVQEKEAAVNAPHFSEATKTLLQTARCLAFGTRNDFTYTGHVALALLDDPTITEVLKILNLSKRELIMAIAPTTTVWEPNNRSRTNLPPDSPKIRTVLDKAREEAEIDGSGTINPIHVLRGIISEASSPVAKVFTEHGVGKDKLPDLRSASKNQVSLAI